MASDCFQSTILGSQIVYGKYLSKCDDVRKSLTYWLQERNIVLVPVKRESMFPLLSIMYLDDAEEYSRKEDSIEKDIQDLGFRGLLVLIHEDFKPSKHVEENVIRLVSQGKVICDEIRHNEEEIWRMKRFIQEKGRMLAFSYDRNKPDYVLLEAVKFIEKECNIRLVDVNDPKDVKNVKGIKESPLVVFCKNDSQLQQDIDHAKRYVRCGSDVMLLVLTNRKDMHLVDTKATEGFGMKSKLIFSSIRKRFRTKVNRECILWLHKFLGLNGYNVSGKLSRSETLKRSFRQLRKRQEEGFYEKLPNVPEEMEKSAVLYFQEKQNLSLHRMGDDCQESRPFILFCRDGESAEDDINQFIENRQTKCDLHMTVVVLLRCERQKHVEIPNVPNIQRLLICSSQEPTILPTPANGRVANKVREFLLANQSIIKKEKDVTYNAHMSTEEENKMSVATNSMKRQPKHTFKCVTHHHTRGFYEKLPNVPEEMEKSAVNYFQEKQNLSLHRMGDDCQESRPFILFCRDCKSAEDDINQFIEKRQIKCGGGLRMTVLLLSCEGQKPVEIPSLPNIQRLFIRSSQEPKILPVSPNVRVSDKVKEFLLAKRSDKESIEFKKEEEVTCKSKRSGEEENKKNFATNSKKQPETSSKHLTQLDTRATV